MDLVDVLYFFAVFAAAVGAGGQVLVLLGILPARRQFPADTQAAIHRTTSIAIDRYMPQAVVVSLAMGVVILVLRHDFSSPATILTLVGILTTLGNMIISLRFNFPINRAVYSWAPDAIPPEYPKMQARWDRVHTIRTTCQVIALVSYLAASLMR
jgi:uncharacterized membrane protein